MRKVFVDVVAKFSRDGQMLPLQIIWEDGQKFQVDKVLDIRRAASMKVGGQGMRYTCRIAGKRAYLFLEENKWFVEGKS